MPIARECDTCANHNRCHPDWQKRTQRMHDCIQYRPLTVGDFEYPKVNLFS